MIFLSDLNHDLNQRFKSNDLNHNNPAMIKNNDFLICLYYQHTGLLRFKSFDLNR